MSVDSCDVPALSVLDRHVVESAFFRDSYRAPLTRPSADVVDIFFAVFGHHPRWLRIVLVARNRLASRFGLAVPGDSDVMNPERKSRYGVGDVIGPWPIFSLTADELVAGRDNKHLDFRVSVLKEWVGAAPSAVVSTVCTTHNVFGKIYLLLVIPFHTWGMRRLVSRAVVEGRL